MVVILNLGKSRLHLLWRCLIVMLLRAKDPLGYRLWLIERVLKRALMLMRCHLFPKQRHMHEGPLNLVKAVLHGD